MYVFWFANIFVLAADYLINKGAPVFLILRFLVARMPQATPMAFPFACLFGALLAFGRLAADNEITALRTSGVSFLRICRTPLVLGIVMFLVSFGVNEKIAPARSTSRPARSTRSSTGPRRCRSSRTSSAAIPRPGRRSTSIPSTPTATR